MNKTLKSLIKRPYFVLIFFFFLLVQTNVDAQSCSTCPDPPTPGIGFDDDVNDEVPISGFVMLGIFAGAVYGIRKIK